MALIRRLRQDRADDRRPFADAFDAVFGERHLSWLCFKRSSLASLGFVASLSLWYVTLTYDRADVLPIIAFGLLTGLFNVPMDYASLLKTRFVIKTIRDRNIRSASLGLLLLDAGLSYSLGFMSCFGASYAALSIWAAGASPYQDPQRFFADWRYVTDPHMFLSVLNINEVASLGPQAVPWLATLMTSLWLWLFMASGLVSRLSRFMNFGFVGLRRWLDVERQPFLAIGVMSIAIVTIAYILFAPIAVLRRMRVI